MKPRVFVTRSLPGTALNKLANYFEMTINREDRVLDKSEIISGLADKEGLLCLLTDTIDKSIFDSAKKLKAISNYAVGFNNIDLNEANKRKIPVCITPGILTEATADLTWALILSVVRNIVPADRYTREGKFTGWAPTLFLGSDLHHKTLGIIGMGRIGQAVVKRASGFSMNVIYTSHGPKEIPDAKFVSLKELLETADIVSLHTPLNAETHHLIGEKELNTMKKSAYLINTTRGPVVNERALIEALTMHKIAGAGLDVYEEEPKLMPGLSDLNNVVLLPHIGSATTETREKMAMLAVDNLIAIFEGKQPFAIANPEVLNLPLQS